MDNAKERINNAANAVCDGLREIGDMSYAIMPSDLAHALADVKKALLNNLRSAIDWEIGWIDARVAGGDRLREEWKQKCSPHEAG
jgi:hypothetical protein